MKPSILVLPILVAAILFLPEDRASAQIVNTFNSNFDGGSASKDWTTASNWTRVAGTGTVPLTPSDKGVVSGAVVSRNLIVNADGIHVGELQYVDGPGTQSLGIRASGAYTLKIDTLTKGGSYNLAINNNTGNLSVEIGILKLSVSNLEIGAPAVGSLDGFKVTGTTTIESGAQFIFNGIKNRAEDLNRIELGNLVLNGTGSLTLGGRGNSNGKAEISSLSGDGIVQVTQDGTHNGTAGTLLIKSANTTPAIFSGILRDKRLAGQPAVLTVVKAGSGIQILSQSAGNSYTGKTTIEKGVLAVTNTEGSGLGSGSVEILNGGILAGSGIVASGSGNSITAKAGASIAPSAHLETGFAILHLNGANNGSSAILDMKEGSHFALRFGADNAGDRIDFTNFHTGGLALFDGGISVNGTGVQEGTFTLFMFDAISGTELEMLGGRLQAGSGFGGYETNFSWNENSILLQVTAIPEPGLTSLFAVTAALLAGLRCAKKASADERNPSSR